LVLFLVMFEGTTAAPPQIGIPPNAERGRSPALPLSEMQAAA
jgi:hypothetical protein